MGPQVPGAAADASALSVRRLADRGEVQVRGEVSFVTHRVWERELGNLVTRSGDVHLELAGLSFIDIKGVTLLVTAARRIQEGGRRMVLHTPPPALRRIMDTLWPGGAADVSVAPGLSAAPERSAPSDDGR